MAVKTVAVWQAHVKRYFFSFLSKNICCGYSKEPSHLDGPFEHPKHMIKLIGPFEHPKHMIKLIAKKIFVILLSQGLFIWSHV